MTDTDAALKSAEMFDPIGQQWQQLPTMSTGRNGCAGVAVGNQFFIVGGRDGNDCPLSTMEMFDLETRKWTNLPPMITGRSKFAAVAVGNSILVFGGRKGHKWISKVEKYDAVEQKWTQLLSMPNKRYDFAAAAIGNKVYIVGGDYDECSNLTTVECYDIDSGDWRTLPPMNHGRSGCSAASLGKRLFVVGGDRLDSAEVFDAETETWNFLPCMMTSERYGCAAAIMGDTLCVLGGCSSMDLSSLSTGEVLCIDKEKKALIEETEAVKINEEKALKDQALTLAQRMKKLEDAFGLESVSDGMLRYKCCVLECEIFGKVQEGNLIHRIEKLESCMFENFH